MATTVIATLQPVWDCRWSRPGHRLTGVPDALQPESAWVCVRNGDRRDICDDECATCPHWEWDSQARTTLTPLTAGARASATMRPVQVLEPLLLLLLGLSAVILVATGVAILTEPLAVPFTVALWLGAAAIAGFAVFGRPHAP